jgi:hypothetical protein
MELNPKEESSGCKIETTEAEPVNAFTYYGSNPRKNKDIYKKHKEWYRDYREDGSRKTNEKLWQARQQSAMNVEKVKPKLGELDNLSMKIAVHTLPVTDKGSILLLDSLENASQEINTWDGILRQAIAYITIKEKKELTKEEILSYYEMCMGGNAKMAWEAMKSTTAWPVIQEEWNKTDGKNSLIPDFFRLQFCGIRNSTETEEKQKKMAIDQLNRIQLCELTDLNLARYNETFNKLLLIIKEPYKREYLDLYFTKLPAPWDSLMKEEYKPDNYDCLGTRMLALKQRIEALCKERQIRKAASQNIKSLCANIKQPVLQFGCSTTRNYESKPKYTSKKRFKQRTPRQAKPKFKQRSTKLVKKPENQVRCFGCRQLGHYLNACPNKGKTPIQHIRMVELIQKAETQGYVLKDEYLTNSEEDYEFSSDSEENKSDSE